MFMFFVLYLDEFDVDVLVVVYVGDDLINDK